MLGALAKRIFGSRNDRLIKSLRPIVDAINAKEAEVAALDDAGVAARTAWLKGRLEAGETLDDILVDAFATVREAAKRTLKQRHFDTQIMGGIVLHLCPKVQGRKFSVLGKGRRLVAHSDGKRLGPI